MVLISIHPFALRKLFLFVVAFLCFSALCLADPVLMVRRYGVRPVSLKISPPTSEHLSSEGLLFDRRNAIDNAIAPAFTDIAWHPDGFRSVEVGPPGLRNPACVRRSAAAAADSLVEPAAVRLRTI